MRQKIMKIARSKKAATAIEYGLIAALIAVAAMTAIQSVASETTDMWNKVGSEVTNN
ncbi:Flp family type IVb pilin [Blastomonas sp. AAP53]|uniref:Flp family type IVb pilin n=1 Tax=Blastomonas sp. AAP53 TaxID=1248760 RepID=UPI00031835DC|nr:Flp family type IVb pilin [Blastomonas sp. AAP53]